MTSSLGLRLKMKHWNCSRKLRQGRIYASKVRIQLFESSDSCSPQQHQAQVPGRVSVACEDESYTKNTLGERSDHPEYNKVHGVKWKPMDDTLICDLSNLYQAASELKPTKRNVIGLSARVYGVSVTFDSMFQAAVSGHLCG